MFLPNKNYTQFRLGCQNKPLNTFLSQNPNKENNYYPINTKNQYNFDTENGAHQTLRVRETQPSTKGMDTHSKESRNVENFNQLCSKAFVINDSLHQFKENLCTHREIETHVRTFCKECGVFRPKSGVNAHREQRFKEKIDNHPDEVYQIMLNKENKNRLYFKDSPHLKCRKHLVAWTCEIANEFKLNVDTLHIAVSYLDTILSQHYSSKIPKRNLEMIALCCLTLAAKFSENAEQTPSYKSLVEFLGESYSIEYLKKFEIEILEMLNWNLKSITPYQFVHFYLSKGCAFSSDFSAIRIIDSKLLRYLRKYSEFFLDLSLEHYDLNLYKSHIVACAAIAGARKAVGLYPIWNNELEELSGVDWKAIESSFVFLYESFEVYYPELANKVNSYADKFSRKNEVIELEQSYAAMSIENGASTPLRQIDYKEDNFESKSSKKKARPSTLTHETKKLKTSTDWAYQKPDEISGSFKICINLMKKISNNMMNIESVRDDLIPKDNLQNKIKKNLAF